MPHLPTRRAAVALVLALAACTPAVRPPPAGPIAAGSIAAREMVSDRLFFGRSIPGGGVVSDEEWSGFVAEVVTPRFPNGLTLWRAEGQWRGADGVVVGEPVMVIEIFHPAGAEADAAVEVIAAEYKRRFRQETVLHVRSPALAWFYE